MDFAQHRQAMIDGQIKPFSVVDPRVLAAFAAVPREFFVTPDKQGMAYADVNLPLGEGCFLIQPALHARLLQEAHVQSHEAVLDIGCLMGYSTAVLSQLSRNVTGIDSDSWVDYARSLASTWSHDGTKLVAGDMTQGVAAHAPYDLIVINGQVQIIPDALVAQLKEGGRIVAYVATKSGGSQATLFIKHNGQLSSRALFDAFVPPLAGFTAAKEFSFA